MILLNLPKQFFYKYFRLGPEFLITWLSLLKQSKKLLDLRLGDLVTYLRQLVKRSTAPYCIRGKKQLKLDARVFHHGCRLKKPNIV